MLIILPGSEFSVAAAGYIRIAIGLSGIVEAKVKRIRLVDGVEYAVTVVPGFVVDGFEGECRVRDIAIGGGVGQDDPIAGRQQGGDEDEPNLFCAYHTLVF
jgi:hypothetical protein